MSSTRLKSPSFARSLVRFRLKTSNQLPIRLEYQSLFWIDNLAIRYAWWTTVTSWRTYLSPDWFIQPSTWHQQSRRSFRIEYQHFFPALFFCPSSRHAHITNSSHSKKKSFLKKKERRATGSTELLLSSDKNLFEICYCNLFNPFNRSGVFNQVWQSQCSIGEHLSTGHTSDRHWMC